MTRLHLDLSMVSGISDAYRMSTGQLMAACGVNLGNLVFRHPLPGLIEDFTAFRQSDYPGFRRALSEAPIDHVLVSAANWLGTGKADEAHNRVRADLFEAVEAPVTCIGLGVQASAGAQTVELGPQTQRLARALSDKAQLVGVRDRLTEKVLGALGIRNSVVLGCPSNFIELEPGLGARVAQKATQLARQDPEWAHLRITLSEISGGNPHSGGVLGWTIDKLAEPGSFYVLQGPDLLPFVLGEADRPPDMYTAHSRLPPEEVARLLRLHSVHFAGTAAWLDFCRTCDLSVGMRIHGAMAALQAGTPALLIAHDRRTAGLADEMGVPQLDPENLLRYPKARPQTLLERVAEAMGVYDEQRCRLAARLICFLSENGLRPKQKLQDIAGGASKAQREQHRV